MSEESVKPFPSVLMAEKAVLSAFIHQPKRFIGRASAEGIDADCFHLRRPLYEVLTETFRESPGMESFDIVTLITRLQLDGALDRCGGPAEIADIYNYTYENFGDWSVWGSQLREAKARRMGMMAAEMMANAETSEDALRTAKDTVASIERALAGRSKAKSGKEAAAAFVAQWKADFESDDAIPGMPTGFDEIDGICGGMRDGQLWIVCAKSTRGKSIMMLQIAANAISHGKTVAIFSAEMTTAEVVGRLVTVLGSVNYEAITQPKKSNKHDRSAMGRGIEAVVGSNVWIEDTSGMTMEMIDGECQRIKDVTGALDMIVIDYLQIVKGERHRGESREQEVARISMGAKQMAKKFGVPVVTASQLNSTGETRESRSLENDADTLLFIADDGVKVGKMRNAKRNQVIPLFMHGDKQKFLPYPEPKE